MCGRVPLEGPLRLYPTAEDDDGIDSCDILVLNSCPPVLVISTGSGSLIHYLLLPPEPHHVVKCFYAFGCLMSVKQ